MIAVHIPTAANIKDVNQQERHDQHQQQLVVVPQPGKMFAQGKFPHCGEWHPFTNPEETAQEHHHGNGAQYADAKLIAACSVALTEEIYHPR
ncbi:hypothetical protein EIMP300_12260 [Escherichia coli]|uniref:Uncharacterized protein n=1 Tax=Escherichia coli TaxID=562 RepID=A0A8S0FGH9_ECOLX|nr:hypothetical protein EIMP300_12260 [Escherichia coli]